MVTLHPQAWINDHAVDIDPGPTPVDVTRLVTQMGVARAAALRDHSDASDGLWYALRDDERPYPHDGPFWIERQDAIAGWVDELHRGCASWRFARWLRLERGVIGAEVNLAALHAQWLDDEPNAAARSAWPPPW